MTSLPTDDPLRPRALHGVVATRDRPGRDLLRHVSLTRIGPGRDLGGVPVVAVIVGVGLLICSVADGMSRATLAPSPWIYWAGIATIAVPTFYRLTSTEASTTERLVLVCMLGLALYVVKLMRDPFGFTLPDEFPHAYNAQQILQHHRLFSPNPLLPVTPGYPGLEGATSAVAELTGMSSFGAGILVIGAARLTMMIALFSLFAALSRSPRTAGLAAAVYAGNSNYLLWGAQFAYESLALPLLIVVLACIAERRATRRSDDVAWAFPITLCIVAIVATHHLTSYLLVATLVVLGGASLLPRRFSRIPDISAFAVIALGLTIAWLIFVATATVGYISPVVSAAIKSTIQTISGEAPPHALFGSSGVAAGVSNDLGEKLMGIAAIVIPLAALPFGLRVVWREQRREPVAVLLAIGAVGYFGVTALRLAPSAWEIANRSAEFMFIGLAFVIALAPLGRLSFRGRPWVARSFLSICGACILIGGAITGWPANSRTSQPLVVAAGRGRIESETAAIGHWSKRLPPGDFVAPDADAFTIALYGDQSSVQTATTADADNILTSPILTPSMLALWRHDRVRYVVVDLRKRATDNVTGFFFSVKPPGGERDQVLPAGVATRFDNLGAPRVYDSGNVLVYDLQSTL